MFEPMIVLRRRRRVYWALLPLMCLAMAGLFLLARSEGSTSLSLTSGVSLTTGATVLWWIFVPSSVIGRCPECHEWFFASIRSWGAWPAGNPFRTTCWNCGASL